MNDFNLALPADSNFQRQMAKRMRASKPIEITMTSGRQYCGWISGLDEDSIQLCLVETLNIVWITRHHIETVAEHKLNIEMKEYKKEELEGYIRRMVQNATKALEEK